MKRLDHPYCSCPKSTGSMVTETRMDTRYGFAWRRRLCLGCGWVFGTYEIPDVNINLASYEPINPDGKLERR